MVRHRPQTVNLARKCGGLFGSLEALATSDLLTFARLADSSDGSGPVLSALVLLASSAIARLPTGFKDRGVKLAAGDAVSYRSESVLGPFSAAAERFVTTGTPEALTQTIETITALPKIVIARKELWKDLEIVAASARDGAQSFTEAAEEIRERARRRGRRPASHVVGTTLLAKGLEYDNVVVTDAHLMDRENLYVALTRATTTLEVLSDARVLNPASP